MGEAGTAKEELQTLGYQFRGGRLLQVGSDAGFEFQDQEHYDKLADAVLRHVGDLLVEEAGLRQILLPLEAAEGEARSAIFVSNGFEAAEKLLLLIQGTGRVRVGVWGCSLCINKDLEQGTMLPYLREAAERGYGIIVLNPNENQANGKPIGGSESPDNHIAYVWEHVVRAKCAPGAAIDLVAHSSGGWALLEFLGRAGSGKTPAKAAAEAAAGAAARLRRLVFTDSYHSPGQVTGLPPPVRSLLADPTRTVNFVPHAAPLGTPVSEWVSLGRRRAQSRAGCACISAGVEDHAATNHAAMGAAFDFFGATG